MAGFKFGGGGKSEVDARAMQIGQDKPVDVSLDGDAALVRNPVEVVDGPDWAQKTARLAFNEERIEIVVHESDDPNSENPVQVAVNGRRQFFIRGQVQSVRRKFVEALARSKRTGYSQNTGSSDPLITNRLYSQTALRYPFSLIRDDNPKGGQAWMRKILAEP